jgi:hypothetical protein
LPKSSCNSTGSHTQAIGKRISTYSNILRFLERPHEERLPPQTTKPHLSTLKMGPRYLVHDTLEIRVIEKEGF